MKRTVHFDPTKGCPGGVANLEEGRNAIIHYPLDHYSALVSGRVPVLTSMVVRINDDGSFETLNTIYVPKAPDETVLP